MNWAFVIGFLLGFAIFGVLVLIGDWVCWNMGWGQFARDFDFPRGAGKWKRKLRSFH